MLSITILVLHEFSIVPLFLDIHSIKLNVGDVLLDLISVHLSILIITFNSVKH